MSIFLILMIAGFSGLALMSLPGLNHHGHAGMGAHGVGHIGHAGTIHAGSGHTIAGHAPHAAGANTNANTHGQAPARDAANNSSEMTALRFLPSPRIIFSLLALFGAFGYGAQAALHLTPPLAALVAVVPAVLLERFALTPYWNRLLDSQGAPAASLETLTMHEAEAVTPFRNGRGVISAVHDGRLIQLSATLRDEQATAPIRVGDKLRIEEIDPASERAVVSLH